MSEFVATVRSGAFHNGTAVIGTVDRAIPPGFRSIVKLETGIYGLDHHAWPVIAQTIYDVTFGINEKAGNTAAGLGAVVRADPERVIGCIGLQCGGDDFIVIGGIDLLGGHPGHVKGVKHEAHTFLFIYAV